MLEPPAGMAEEVMDYTPMHSHEEVERYRTALGLLRGYVEMESEGWHIINDALALDGRHDR